MDGLAEPGFSPDRFWLAAWVWIPGLAACVALGWAGFQHSTGPLPRRLLPVALVLAASAVMLLVLERATLSGEGAIPDRVSIPLVLGPPAILAASAVVWIRASPYWAGCIIVATALAIGVHNATASGPVDTHVVVLAALTAIYGGMVITLATAVLLAILFPTTAAARYGWRKLT